MGRPPTWLVEDRRESVQYFLGQGLSLREIATKLQKPLATIERDILAMERARREKRERERELIKRERAEMEKQLRILKERTAKLRTSVAPVSRGAKRPMSLIQRRQGLVNVFRVLGRTQKRIAELLETPLRTIQRDCYSLDVRVVRVYQLKDLEKMIKRKLGWLEDAEILEWCSDGCSEERRKEILALNDERRRRE